MQENRGVVNLADVIITAATLVCLLVLAPYIYHFIGMVSTEADPLSSLLLQLAVPVLFMALIVSVGVSARGGA